MTDSIRQLISLVTYGKEVIKGHLEEFDTSTLSSFKDCSTIKFVEVEKPSFFSKGKEVLIAENTSEWFKYLNEIGCKELKIQVLPIKVKSFQKGHSLVELVFKKKNWLIEVVHENGSDFWTYRWLIDSEKQAKNLVGFNITYGLVSTNKAFTNKLSSIEDSKLALENSLMKISKFAESQKLDKWKKQFEFAAKTLSSDNPESNFPFKDLTPKDQLTLSSRQLLYSSFESWVFNPHHSSWSQLKFTEMETKVKHLKLNIELMDSIIGAMSTSINSNKTTANNK